MPNSSYRAYIGKVQAPEILYGAEIMSNFSNSPEAYRRFAEEIEMKKVSRTLWKRLTACLAERQLRKD